MFHTAARALVHPKTQEVHDIAQTVVSSCILERNTRF